MTSEIMTTAEVASYMRVCVDTVLRLHRKKLLAATGRTSPKGHLRFRKSTVDSYLYRQAA